MSGRHTLPYDRKFSISVAPSNNATTQSVAMGAIGLLNLICPGILWRRPSQNSSSIRQDQQNMRIFRLAS
jgi:hypothetical protein